MADRPEVVQVYFTLERCEAVWLEQYLRDNPTTLSEKLRLAVATGIFKFDGRMRLADIDEQVAALKLESAALYDRVFR